MRKKYLIPLCLLSLCLFGCDKSNDVKTPTSKEETVEVSTSTEKLELVGFNKNIKTDEIINPGMGFYRTKYLTLKRETEKPEYDFSYNGFYHVRIDLSDFSKANNGEDDYISYVTQVYTPNGWLINGVHYDNGATYTVNGNYERIPDYTYEITPATFPEDPEKENYVFEGWYSGEDKYTSYALMDSLVLTARWKGNTITELDPEVNGVPAIIFTSLSCNLLEI